MAHTELSRMSLSEVAADLSAPNLSRRQAAFEELDRRAAADGADDLGDLFDDAQDPGAQGWLLELIMRHGGKWGVRKTREALCHPAAYVREVAIELLLHSGRSEVPEIFEEALYERFADTAETREFHRKVRRAQRMFRRWHRGAKRLSHGPGSLRLVGPDTPQAITGGDVGQGQPRRPVGVLPFRHMT